MHLFACVSLSFLSVDIFSIGRVSILDSSSGDSVLQIQAGACFPQRQVSQGVRLLYY